MTAFFEIFLIIFSHGNLCKCRFFSNWPKIFIAFANVEAEDSNITMSSNMIERRKPKKGEKLKSPNTHFISVIVHMRCSIAMCVRMNDIMPDGMCTDQREQD